MRFFICRFLSECAAGLFLVFIAAPRPLHLDFSISKIQMGGTYGEVCTKKSIYQRKQCLCGIILYGLLGKQQAYIDSLKERIGQEADYAGRMRDEKYEQERKVQKANQRIFELQKTNQQMEKLLKKIPPEVIEELQKSNPNRAKER